jgi:hypothetical protein
MTGGVGQLERSRNIEPGGGAQRLRSVNVQNENNPEKVVRRRRQPCASTSLSRSMNRIPFDASLSTGRCAFSSGYIFAALRNLI